MIMLADLLGVGALLGLLIMLVAALLVDRKEFPSLGREAGNREARDSGETLGKLPAVSLELLIKRVQ